MGSQVGPQDEISFADLEGLFNLSLFSFVVGTLALNARFDLRRKKDKEMAFIPFSFILAGVLFVIAFASFGSSGNTAPGVWYSLVVLIGAISYFVATIALAGALVCLLEFAWLKSEELKPR